MPNPTTRRMTNPLTAASECALMISAYSYRLDAKTTWQAGSESYLAAGLPARFAIATGSQAADLLDAHLPGAVEFVMAEPAEPDPVAAVLTARGFRQLPDWVWMYFDRPPARQDGEQRVARLEVGADVRAEIQARCNPDTHIAADQDDVSWWGYRHGDGSWAAICAVEEVPPGAHGGSSIHGLGVDPAYRRQGIASALMAAVTRHYLQRDPLVHFGVWLSNEAALAAYRRLGVKEGQLVRGWSKRGR